MGQEIQSSFPYPQQASKLVHGTRKRYNNNITNKTEITLTQVTRAIEIARSVIGMGTPARPKSWLFVTNTRLIRISIK